MNLLFMYVCVIFHIFCRSTHTHKVKKNPKNPFFLKRNRMKKKRNYFILSTGGSPYTHYVLVLLFRRVKFNDGGVFGLPVVVYII